MKDDLLLTAGPTPISYNIRKALNQSISFHRSTQFIQRYKNLTDGLKYLFQTNNDVLIQTTSGTGGLEAVISNLFSAGDNILVVENGKFSERWALIAERFKLIVNRLKVPWGKSVTVDQLAKKLQNAPRLKAVFLTHCETSTGALTNLETIVPQIRNISSALTIVDAISSAAIIPLKVDDWGIDVAVTASQKGLGLPPGLAMVSLSKKAWEYAERSNLPKFYLDFFKAQQALVSGKGAAFTPAIPLILAADLALQEIRHQGLQNIWEQRRLIAENFRKKIIDTGLKVYPTVPADSLTVFKIDHLKQANFIPAYLQEKYNIVVSKGQGELANKVIRIGHMVNISETDLDRFLEAFQETINNFLYHKATENTEIKVGV